MTWLVGEGLCMMEDTGHMHSVTPVSSVSLNVSVCHVSGGFGVRWKQGRWCVYKSNACDECIGVLFMFWVGYYENLSCDLYIF